MSPDFRGTARLTEAPVPRAVPSIPTRREHGDLESSQPPAALTFQTLQNLQKKVESN